MESQIIQTTKSRDFVFSSFFLRKNGLEPIGNPTFRQWQDCGGFIKKAESSAHFWIGDWINYGEKRWGEKYSQALEETGFDYSTLRDDAYVARQVELSRRHDNLSFAIHKEVAPFKPEEQEELLDKAEKLGFTRQELRKEKHRLALDAKRQTSSITDTNLILGDATTELEKLPDKSIDCLITDPPYGIDYQSNRRIVKPQLDKISGDTNEAFRLLDEVCEVVKRKIKDNSHLYFFTSWKVYSKFEAIIQKYFKIVNILIWDKLNHGSGDLEGSYGERYEMIIFATNGRRILNGERDDDIIAYSRVANQSHPTEKPVGLIKKLIEKSTNEGELVVDVFVGSGSTCIAAKNLKRKYLGIEIDKNWFEIAKRRMYENQ